MELIEKMALNFLHNYELELLSHHSDFISYHTRMKGNILEPDEQKARLTGAIEVMELLLLDYEKVDKV